MICLLERSHLDDIDVAVGKSVTGIVDCTTTSVVRIGINVVNVWSPEVVVTLLKTVDGEVTKITVSLALVAIRTLTRNQVSKSSQKKAIFLLRLLIGVVVRQRRLSRGWRDIGRVCCGHRDSDHI